MMPLKRRKVVPPRTGSTGNECGGANRFPQVVLFLLERKMGSSRRDFLSQLGRNKGFQVEEVLSERVTHVISEKNCGAEVRRWMDTLLRGRGPTSAQLLDISWYTDSMSAGHPVEILDRHKLQEQQVLEAETSVFSVPGYACQRRTPLDRHNAVLTDALSLLAENAELGEDEGRGVAFRRAAAVLKALPKPVREMKELRGLPCLGGHSLRVIQEVLENGASGEVESTKRSERYRAMKVLTGIFGVGTKTASRWFREGIRNPRQLQESGQNLTRAQRTGVQFYQDLNRPVTRAQADAVGQIVEKAVASVSPGAQVTLTGGFRRGNLTGHDVDFLITHPQEGREEGLVLKVVSWLESKGLLLYQTTSRNSYLESEDHPERSSSNMDHYERCFSIFKLSEEQERGTGDGQFHVLSGAVEGLESRPEAWRAVRVDLVVSPSTQFAFALLGWTGSKLFERELRRWAGLQKAMTLSSHALYDRRQRKNLRASSEEEIFALLGLDYIPPSERNA